MKSQESQFTGLYLPAPVRITEQVWAEGTVPVVSVLCWAYNHVNFIREAIEGFLMQETTFPVEILIHDDASTDGTIKIIREYEAKYPQLFRNIIQKENQCSQGKSINRPLFHAVRGEFIAICEGDDFWVTPNKLENQILVFRNRPNILFCGGGCRVLHDETGRILEISPPASGFLQEIKAGNYFPGASSSPWIHTCTRVFPNSILQMLPEKFCIDTLMLHWLASKFPEHKIVWLPEVVATYRVHARGIWSGMESSVKDEALVSIYSKAAGLHKGYKKTLLLTRAIEHAQLLAKHETCLVGSRLFWELKVIYLKSLRFVSSLL